MKVSSLSHAMSSWTTYPRGRRSARIELRRFKLRRFSDHEPVRRNPYARTHPGSRAIERPGKSWC